MQKDATFLHNKETDKFYGCFFQNLTYIDIAMMNLMMTLEDLNKGFKKNYPTLNALCDRVQARPNIKKWLDTRPKTQF